MLNYFKKIFLVPLKLETKRTLGSIYKVLLVSFYMPLFLFLDCYGFSQKFHILLLSSLSK